MSSSYDDYHPFIQRRSEDFDLEHRLHTHVFRERIPLLSTRKDIIRRERPSSDHIHEVIFVIPQMNMDELTRILYDVSDPLSSSYGQHLTREEVTMLTSNPESRDIVMKYLHSIGAVKISETLHGDYIVASARIEVWEEMFDTEFYIFHQIHEDKVVDEVIRAEKYWIPKELDSHVESVLKAIDIHSYRDHHGPMRHSDRAAAMKGSKWLEEVSYDGYITPLVIKKYYNMSSSVKGSAASTQCAFGSTGQYFSPSDIFDFQTRYTPPARPVVASIGNHSSDIKCKNDQSACAEANLDLEYLMTVSEVSPTTYWYTESYFHDWLLQIASSANPPLVISISYGSMEKYVAAGIHKAFTAQAIKLGTMGITIVAASGDDGSNDSDSVNEKGLAGCGYDPFYPASNPFVLSVGATMVRMAV